MTNLVITECHIVKWVDKFTAPSSEVFGFELVRYDANGAVTPANGTDATEVNFEGFATEESNRVGQGITVVRDGILDVGNALSALAVGTVLYSSDTDGQLSDSASDSTVDVIAARVIAGQGSASVDKLLLIRKGG